jgi:hypothetical protein
MPETAVVAASVFSPTISHFHPGGGFVIQEDADAFDARWAGRERDPAAFFSTPPQVTVIGVKR